MRFRVFATDYDGTLATHGQVEKTAIEALLRVRASGRQLLLVTGRQLPDLQAVFPEWTIFDRVIAENGALLFRPSSGEEVLLSEAPDDRFLAALGARKIPFTTGRAIVASDDAHHAAIASVIHELALSLQLHIILNKGSLMVLPAQVDKATGLRAALSDLELQPASVVGIGDAENDAVFLSACGCAAAVANALPQIKRMADVVTNSRHGAGVVELADQLLDDGLARYALRHTLG